MAANRYGRIYHSDHHYINLRFHSVDARREFAEQFEKYHAGHDHDGEAPRFENTAASVIGNPESNTIHDAHSVSIDGYATYEIEAYHNPDRWNRSDRGRYRPPTCCVPPTISINRTFVDASTLTRHELSAIFMDMPEEDFQNLLKSVEKDGFKDPVIRMIDEQVLDGWHRYRAAKELNLLRKLRFQQWKEKDEGDPAAFVLARNIERRHLNPGQRAQIVVSFNERFGHGGDRSESKSPNGDLKTREELAKEAGVGARTIDRAVQVEKAGQSEKVIAGEKSAGEVITEETVKSLWEQINPAISEWKKAREGVGHASKSMFVKATLRFMGVPSDTETDVKVLKNLLELLTSKETNVLEDLVRKQLEGNALWGNASLDTETAEKQTEQPPQTAKAREASKRLKQKKQVIKSLWDKRIEAARDYVGDGDSDLNLHVTLPELEKGFAKCEAHKYCADAFLSAMRRTSEQTFNICLEKTLSSDVSLEVLGAESKAVSTYALDILQWKKQQWIQQLIAAKKAKAKAAAAETEKPAETPPRPEPDMNALWEVFNTRYPKWKAKYAESGYKENDLIQASTETELFDALRIYRDSDRTGAVTAEEIQDATALMKSQSYPFARRVRDVVREKIESSVESEVSHHDDRDRTTSRADTSLDDLNLPALKSFLDSLMYHVGSVEHPITRDDFSVAVFDALVDNDLTEREQLSILLECAQSIVTEYL